MRTEFTNSIASTLPQTLKWARYGSCHIHCNLCLKAPWVLRNRFKLVALGSHSRSEFCRTSLRTCRCNPCSTSQIRPVPCNNIVVYQSRFWACCRQLIREKLTKPCAAAWCKLAVTSAVLVLGNQTFVTARKHLNGSRSGLTYSCWGASPNSPVMIWINLPPVFVV